jgi:formylmethanofuran dehydrogenase subunit C
MSMKGFMNEAYQGKARSKHLETRRGDIVFGLEDLADRVGLKPSRQDVEALAPDDPSLLARLIASDPGRKYGMIWGILSSIAAERSPEPLRLPCRDFIGLELRDGVIVLERARDHLGERMRGGRIFVRGNAGDYLGQEMAGGGVVAGSCGDYAFRKMRAGWGVVLGDAGKFLGIGNCGGRIAVRGGCGERAGWLMRGGSLRVRGDAGDYLGLLMSGGELRVSGKAGKRAGWRMRGGTILAHALGPEAAASVMGLE